jgi:hypothetical protein
VWSVFLLRKESKHIAYGITHKTRTTIKKDQIGTTIKKNW